MRFVRRFLIRMGNSATRRRHDKRLREEIEEHLALQTTENLRAGLSPAEARRQAILRFGAVEAIKEAYQAERGLPFIHTFARDMRFALRLLHRSPSFTAVAVLTLALGIGANTAIFSMVDGLTLRLPPIAKAQQVTTLAYQELGGGYSNGFSYPDFADIRSQSTAVFSEVAGSMDFRMDGLSAEGKSESMWAGYVTGNFFRTMGANPALGNFIEPRPGSSLDYDPVLVLGYSFWQGHFGGDPHVIGKSVLVNGHPVTIIGVAPRDFHGITSLLDTQGYLPLGMASITGDSSKGFLTNRKSTDLTIVARLKPGVTLGSAQPALNLIAHRLSAQYPSTDKWRSLAAFALGPMSPVADPDTPNVMRLIGALFMTLAGLVLILACLNVANLLLARASGRQREMAVRAAVGGGRSRLIRQLLTESLLLALLGCAAGIVLGLMSSRWLGSINLKTAIPFVLDFHFDWRVFAYGIGMALLTAVFVGIAPALRATRGNLNGLLHESGHTGAGRQRTRGALVVGQVGGSLMLLIVAGLFVRSLRNVQHSNLGFEPSHVLNLTIDPHGTGYNEAQARDLLKDLLTGVRALPGVETASLAKSVPMGYGVFSFNLRIEGYQPPAGQGASSAGYNAVSSEYFETMHIPILRGRGISDSDGQTSPYVAVINEAMAQKYWHGDAIGRVFADVDDPKESIKVVGVAKNSLVGGGFSDPIGPYVYLPLMQRYDHQMPVTLQLRTSLPLATIDREVLRVVHGLAPTMPVFDVQTMIGAMDTLNGFMLFELGAGLAAALGILGLVLAIVGVYGVVSYGATQRTNEIGIRMALGAQRVQVLRMILRQGLFVVCGGTVVGVFAAAGIAHLVGKFLVGVSGFDAITYFGAVFILAVIALVACYIPARRAMGLEPMAALRHE
jgi:predicted permease